MIDSLNRKSSLKVLIVIPYEFYPPKGGGALRCFYATKELSKYFDVAVLTNQDFDTFENDMPDIFKGIKFFKAGGANIKIPFFRFLIPKRVLNYLFFKLFFKGGKTSVNSMFLNFYTPLKLSLNEFCPDVVIFENLESLFYLSNIVRKYESKIKIIYEAHNVDHVLWKKLADAENNIEYLRYSKNAYKIESTIDSYTDCVVCVTKEDESILRGINNTGIKTLYTTVASGVDVDLKTPALNYNQQLKPKILFCGSLNYLPNIEGIRWFYDKVMPLLRSRINDFEIVIIGNCENLDQFTYLKGDTNINLVGRVEDVAPYYHDSLLSIVPLLSGSGIRLKITESMSFGCPVISTTLGAEGIAYDENSIVIADTPEDFAEAIIMLLKDVQLTNKLSKNGRLLVEQKYDWKMLMGNFRDIIHSLN